MLTTEQSESFLTKKNSGGDDPKGFYTTTPNFNRPALKVKSR